MIRAMTSTAEAPVKMSIPRITKRMRRSITWFVFLEMVMVWFQTAQRVTAYVCCVAFLEGVALRGGRN